VDQLKGFERTAWKRKHFRKRKRKYYKAVHYTRGFGQTTKTQPHLMGLGEGGGGKEKHKLPHWENGGGGWPRMKGKCEAEQEGAC